MQTWWLPCYSQALNPLPKSLESKPSRIRWIALLVKQDFLQSKVVLDCSNDNPPIWAVECDIFAFVNEIDLVCLWNRKCTVKIKIHHGGQIHVAYHGAYLAVEEKYKRDIESHINGQRTGWEGGFPSKYIYLFCTVTQLRTLSHVDHTFIVWEWLEVRDLLILSSHTCLTNRT